MAENAFSHPPLFNEPRPSIAHLPVSVDAVAPQPVSRGVSQQAPPSSPPKIGLSLALPFQHPFEPIRMLLFRLDRRYPGYDFSRHGNNFVMERLNKENMVTCPEEMLSEVGMPDGGSPLLQGIRKGKGCKGRGVA